jgi:hypothetical protein
MADGQAMEYSLMNLHKDNEAFSELVAVAAETIGLPEIYVEKDYWISKALKYLSESAYVNDVVFKGGTSLSKAYRLIDRFSEDIDLAVFSEGKGDSVRKTLLKHIESTVTQNLVYLKGDIRESKGSKFRKTVYQYPRSIHGTDFGQASSELLVEVNAFTQPEPFGPRVLRTLIAEVLAGKGQNELINKFGLEDFTINVLSVRRTLVEKVLGIIKDSYHDDPVAKLSNRIRHLYDICLILREDEFKRFIYSDDFSLLCQQCVGDEKAGAFGGADYLAAPLVEAPLFAQFEHWRASLEITYKGTFSDLVYGDLPTMDEIADTLLLLKGSLEAGDC